MTTLPSLMFSEAEVFIFVLLILTAVVLGIYGCFYEPTDEELEPVAFVEIGFPEGYNWELAQSQKDFYVNYSADDFRS